MGLTAIAAEQSLIQQFGVDCYNLVRIVRGLVK